MREVMPTWVDFAMSEGCDGKRHAGLLPPPPVDDDEPAEFVTEMQVADVEAALNCGLYRDWAVCETQDVLRVLAAAAQTEEEEADVEALSSGLSETQAWDRYRTWFSDWPKTRAWPYIDFHCRHLTLGEIGAALSHLGLIEAAAREGAAAPKMHVFFEDDARPLPGAMQRLFEEVSLLEQHNFAWDLIYIRASLYSKTPEEPLREVPGSRLYRAQHRKVTDAYCLSRRGLARIAACGYRCSLFAFDDFLPSLHSPHPRRDVMQLACVKQARCDADGGFIGLSFGEEVLSEVARVCSETNLSPCVLGDHGAA